MKVSSFLAYIPISIKHTFKKKLSIPSLYLAIYHSRHVYDREQWLHKAHIPHFTRRNPLQINPPLRWWQGLYPLPFWLKHVVWLPPPLQFGYMSINIGCNPVHMGDGCHVYPIGWPPPFWYPLGGIFWVLGLGFGHRVANGLAFMGCTMHFRRWPLYVGDWQPVLGAKAPKSGVNGAPRAIFIRSFPRLPLDGLVPSHGVCYPSVHRFS